MTDASVPRVGTIVVVGRPVEKVDFDIALLSIKEATITSVFRYAPVSPGDR